MARTSASRELSDYFTIPATYGEHFCLVHEPLGISIETFRDLLPGRYTCFWGLMSSTQKPRSFTPTYKRETFKFVFKISPYFKTSSGMSSHIRVLESSYKGFSSTNREVCAGTKILGHQYSVTSMKRARFVPWAGVFVKDVVKLERRYVEFRSDGNAWHLLYNKPLFDVPDPDLAGNDWVETSSVDLRKPMNFSEILWKQTVDLDTVRPIRIQEGRARPTHSLGKCFIGRQREGNQQRIS
ncbi:hypothetical protein D0863_11214 [Hortaea werneckii]|uniref:Uncharacterized protein n=1 Tax=Hortaea werneckii TaxID=91943 RepID=A0A3M7DBF9_HORWE|nr:hypothetical protein D0863_11214 [Hortaea werneckii]